MWAQHASLKTPAVAMMSMLMPKKTVGFQSSAGGALSSSSSDSDSDEEETGKHILKKAMQLTTKHKLKSLVGDALQLTRRNTMAVEDFKADAATNKLRRITKMRSVGKKALHIPKLAELVCTSQDKPINKVPKDGSCCVDADPSLQHLQGLTFDVAEFKRDHRTEFLLTDE
nr:hypothetical protein BaRGS_013322 [Batillaria attramentaria]